MAKIPKFKTGKLILIGLAVLIGTLLISSSGLLHQVQRLGETIEGLHALAKMAEADTVKADSTQQDDPSIAAARSTASKQAAVQAKRLGLNISGVSDYGTEWPFVDIFKSSRPWTAQTPDAGWGEGGPLALTPEGWVASLRPSQFAEAVLMGGSGGHYPKGQYTLLYEGQGKIGFGRQGVEVVSQSPGRMVLNVTPKDHGIFLQILETNPANPIRNIRFIMPGFETTYEQQPFHPLFLERISKFSPLRFMDWEVTNESPLKEWLERTTLASATQVSTNGAALEYLVQLSNTLHIDPWFTIPHQASDDYVIQFASFVREHLDRDRTIYIEYSNEIWNDAFGQTRYAEEQGMALGLSDDRPQAALRYYSQRAVEVFKIWENVFGGHSRLVRVLASQAYNPWAGEQVLSWKNAYQQADAFAIAPYFYGGDVSEPKNADSTATLSPDQIIEKMLTEIRTTIRRIATKNAAIAKKYGVSLITYEGGPHLTSQQMPEDKQERITKLFTAVNRHPRMREVYKEYLAQWRQSGGGLFMQFSSVSLPNKYGAWGMLEYQDQNIQTAPKYLGLMDDIATNASTKR